MTSDEQLMLQFQQGAREAFAELFERYRQPIYAFFRRRLNDAARAEELAQETFLAVLKAAARYEPRALFRTYLYGIALNLLAAERRKAGRQASEALAIGEEEQSRQAGMPTLHADPEAGIWVRQGLAQLEAEQREVLMLREYEQLSYAEIADVLRVPVNTVRSQLFRARLALKELLAPERRNLVRDQT
jgi:RNA polymerase sigma-70 factor (ECF subfamily)